MRIERGVIVGAGLGALLCAGCQGVGHVKTWDDPLGPRSKVTVRFVAPPDQFAMENGNTPVHLTSDGAEPGDYRAALWGGDFEGTDVTFGSTELPTGPYMFGLFDPDRGGAYQGWISVNSAGDDVIASMEDWKESIQKQQSWLAYEAKAGGEYEARDANAFTKFEENLYELRSLENRISKAIHRERAERNRRGLQQSETLAGAEVLIVPGGENFLRPWTRPTFSQEELSTVRAGTPLTKFVLVGDYESASGKLRRVSELRDDIERNRSVFNEEVRRLEHRRRFYQITDHLYNHGCKFVQNEKRLQEARGMVAKLDRQINDYNEKYEAILFVTGLFAPDEALAKFDEANDKLNRERAVASTHIEQIENQINEVSQSSKYRVRMEQRRQDAYANQKRIDNRMAQIDRAKSAVRSMRDSTAVIHRHGPASVVAATMIDQTVPPQYALAIERESLLTVRLQASNGPRGINGQNGEVRTTSATPINWDQVFQNED